MLICKNITKSYRQESQALNVLKGIHLEVQKGEVVAIVGASGAGKSTLLHILGTLDTADSGELWIRGQEVTKMSGSTLARFRNRHVGFVFQFHNLLPEFTALENVLLPSMIGGAPMKALEPKALDLLRLLGLEQRIHHRPAELSGGEQQRIAVARALINSPDIVFADEPSGNLDSANASELHQLFFKLRQDLDCTFVIVTHNEGFANMADRKIQIRDGVIVRP